VSRALNVYITKTEDQLVLWDLQNKVRKTKHPKSDLVETTMLSDDIIAETGERMAGSLGLMPFYDISEIPADAEWTHVADAGVETYTKETKVYDLTWSAKAYDGSVVFKWRFFVDHKTNLPRRIEIYQKLLAEDDYIFMSSKEIEYLSDSKMQEVIKEASF
jgi:sugar/nucleoside kinase (ribokinase family)